NGADPFVPAAIIAESLLLTSGITSIVKHSVARPRPYVYEVDVPPGDRPDNGGLVSFWSGHTSTVSSTTFACAALVQRSNASGALKTVTWIGAAVLPAAAGFFRIKAGRHFPTDVLTGYAFGALIGTAVPYFHRTE
ncbi:MAG: phosphatase PAP2 family protein, partial [Bacteroidota bacterium]|nr:phosphatase PAP2 family protein [Bacteroidota bacterium]